MAPPSHVLVLGAGEPGMQVLEHLATHSSRNARGTRISVTLQPSTVKNPSAAKAETIEKLRAWDVTVVPFDISSSTVESFASFLDEQGADALVSCTGSVLSAGSQRKMAEAAIASSSVKRYIPWQFGVDYDIIRKGSTQPLFDEQYDIRGLLRGQHGTEWVIISVGIFMTLLFETYWGVLDRDSGTVRAFESWDNAVTTTAPEDIGKCTAEMIMVDWEEIRNSCVYVAGDTVTYDEIASTAGKVFGTPLQKEIWTEKALKEDWAANKDDILKCYRPIWAVGKGVAWRKEDSYNTKKGMKTIGIEDWMKQLNS